MNDVELNSPELNGPQERTARRNFLRQLGRLTTASVASGLIPGIIAPRSVHATPDEPIEGKHRPRVAFVMTECWHRSHAHVFLENFLGACLFNGKWTDPGVDIVSFYVDNFPENDMARGIAKEYGIPIFPSIRDALCLGGETLAVDAVASIAEHGTYPTTEKGQMMYPRKKFFDEIVAVFRKSGRSVPVFNDKHLSYRWDWAMEMVATSRELGFAFLAGSSVPLAQRWPSLELADNAPIVEAVSIHGGGPESYDIHGLEVLQSMVEARRGHETGVKRVQFLEKDALWQAAKEGRWDPELARSAMSAELGPGLPPLEELHRDERFKDMHGILVDYKDGLRGLVLKLGNYGMRWNFACRLAGDESHHVTRFYVGPWENRNLFKALSHAVQTLFRQRESPYPIERSLLTTGVVAAAMDSRFEGGKLLDTPHLEFSYRANDWSAMREMGESWKTIHEGIPQPRGLYKKTD
jgi:hypothetical protein